MIQTWKEYESRWQAKCGEIKSQSFSNEQAKKSKHDLVNELCDTSLYFWKAFGNAGNYDAALQAKVNDLNLALQIAKSNYKKQ